MQLLVEVGEGERCQIWEEEVEVVEARHHLEAVLELHWVSCCRRHRGKPGRHRCRCCSR